MANAIEKQSSFGSRRHDEPEFDLKEWALRARISRGNTNSRRFSASNLKSFREDERSLRSNITISSSASSPGYTIREEIDPSKYSFTTALKALQAKTLYTWEYLSPDGLTLNSKWNDAEKYICNPLSGEVPLECLSAKTLSARSFRGLKSRITMSAPLIYHSQLQQFQAKSPIIEHETEVKITIQEENRSTTRDVGTQSTPTDLSPSRSPSTEQRAVQQSEAEAEDSPASTGKPKSAAAEVEVRETREKGRERKQMMWRWCSNTTQSGGGGGCLSISLRRLWPHKTDNHKPTSPTFLYHINNNACYKE
ncbi:uncharacterized protein LOC105178351 [Sesamum indicum]|uniref:Uncharacterized protein LOC105178351 n=1 Tax=Sesamum indicum TaxID=4182 RepID=A0A8M8VDL2_SESIN|nr:uncharacterized protein LOC105178351 [Sesamum indicum]